MVGAHAIDPAIEPSKRRRMLRLVEAPIGDPVNADRYRRAHTGMQATLMILVAVAVVMLAFTRSDALPVGPMLALLAAATAGVACIIRMPWARLESMSIGSLVMYAWAVFDVLLITLAISLTGAGTSELFMLYGLTTALFVITYPARGQSLLLAFTAACYLSLLALDGWQVSAPGLMLRMSFLGTLALICTFVSRELTTLLASQSRIVGRLRELDDLRSDFLSTVSHELRTPLTVISGLAMTLHKHGERIDDEVRTDLVGRIAEQSGELDRLITQLLDFAKAEKGQLRMSPEACDLGKVLRASISKLDRALARHDVKLCVPAGAEAVVDVHALDRVLHNLLTNAAKFSPAGTTISVRAVQRGNELVVEVEDEGPGIPMRERRKIFDRFYRIERTDQAKEGTGIGLAIVKQFAEAHGGRVWVEPRRGGGSIFGFSFG